ncbi:tetraspanin-7-like isoform x1 protein [Lasius niger]|uniref:Tetraspanin n=1 Tax=Lasius niger TaxID=67767 RepID=A0A0J7KVW6_LASNI|nr:tetraspanin-7-like isoform x1 protein [Lasius niger]
MSKRLETVATMTCMKTLLMLFNFIFWYGAFLALVALLELGAGASIYAYRTNLNEGFDQGLNESMAAYGQDRAMSSHIDTMQSTLHCCGNRGYTDWPNMNPPKEIPLSCCKQSECEPDDVDQIYTDGCYNRVLDFINGNIGLVAGTAIGVAFFPLVGIFLACCLASNINKAEYEQVA